MSPSARSLSSAPVVRWLVVVLASGTLGAGIGVAAFDRPETKPAPVAVHQEAATTSAPPAAHAAAAVPAQAVSQSFKATLVAATPDTVTVQGIGTIQGVPDVVTVGLQVSVTRPEAADALDAANTAVGKVLTSLRHNGVQANDIQTTGISLQPQYDYSGNTSHLTGYQAGQSITARLRSASKRGATISGAAGASSGDVAISGLSYDLEKDGPLLTRAQQAAFAAARAKALRYAGLAGRSLGRVITVSEASTEVQSPQPYPGGFGLAAGAAPASSVPLAVGTTPVSVSVTITWALR